MPYLNYNLIPITYRHIVYYTKKSQQRYQFKQNKIYKQLIYGTRVYRILGTIFYYVYGII